MARAGRARTQTAGAVAVAINLLFSYLDPRHERALAAALARGAARHARSRSRTRWRRSGASTSAATRRSSTPTCAGSIGSFAEQLERRARTSGGVREPLLPAQVQRRPGRRRRGRAPARRPRPLRPRRRADRRQAASPARTGAPDASSRSTWAARAATSASIARRARSQYATQYEFEWGLPIAVPVVDLTTIGAGGGSIARLDQGGLLQRRAARARAPIPGPAAYGHGRDGATVTDANLVLGRLNPDYFLGGELALDLDLAQRRGRAARGAARAATLEDAAQAIVERRRREHGERDPPARRRPRPRLPRASRSIAFGGAGPLHAALIARRVGTRRRRRSRRAPASARRSARSPATCGSTARLTRTLRSDSVDRRRAARAACAPSRARRSTTLRREGAIRRPGGLAQRQLPLRRARTTSSEVPSPIPRPAGPARRWCARVRRDARASYGYRIAGAVGGARAGQRGGDRRRPPSACRRSRRASGRGAATPSASSGPSTSRATGWVPATIVRRGDLRPRRRARRARRSSRRWTRRRSSARARRRPSTPSRAVLDRASRRRRTEDVRCSTRCRLHDPAQRARRTSAAEMALAMMKTSYSTIFNEGLDFSTRAPRPRRAT